MSTSCSRSSETPSSVDFKGGSIRLPPFSFACFLLLAGLARLRQNRPWLVLGKNLQMNYLLVFIGGGLGSSLRHAINLVSARARNGISVSHLHRQHHRSRAGSSLT
jgi:hypothetical protein